jgi:hypothetical protein
LNGLVITNRVGGGAVQHMQQHTAAAAATTATAAVAAAAARTGQPQGSNRVKLVVRGVA